MIPPNMEELARAVEILQDKFVTDPLVTNAEVFMALSDLLALQVSQAFVVEKMPEIVRELLAFKLAQLVGDLAADIPLGNWYVISSRLGELDVTIIGRNKPPDEWLIEFSRKLRDGFSVWPVFKE